MIVNAAAKSDVGLRRTRNEDSFCIDNSIGLYVVADGVGGSQRGELASKMAVESICGYIRAKGNTLSESITGLLYDAIKRANQEIYELSLTDDSLAGMATTVVAALVREDRVGIAHVGDSRLYLIRGGNIEALTDDHSLVAEQIRRGILTKEEADEVGMRNVITRSLGFTPEVEPDTDEMTIYDGDVLLLCSDGLYTMVPERAILLVVNSSDNPVEVSNRLIGFANKKGGRDNITVIVGYVYKKRLFSFMYNFFKWFRR
ncbi:MAG: Stp1/IreP family PP2C-type Ser/Thr phosphatase [Nitrospirae bacterium]|nr:Stp1/IreP family PP2C-type Ser/Thr phosphatase [Nitrospirota bacterium]MBF0536568.1 Stp1/IreP family PP2C-type Ser/Thr phosphatase [Nitrospirota bacterium]MBF0618462.1 Stp1/IreP family PP2C-type Ser/Thr phosphatase [Nitrospirota bacterium]